MEWGLGINLWELILIAAFWAGLGGLFLTPIVVAVLWYCDWRDGIPINFCFDAITVIATPFAWIYAVVQLIILYCH